MDGVVGKELGAVMDDGVKVVGTADVVARNDGDECRGAVRASGLYTTESVRLDGIGGTIAVTLGLHAGVDPRRVGTPKLNVGVSNWLAV